MPQVNELSWLSHGVLLLLLLLSFLVFQWCAPLIGSSTSGFNPLYYSFKNII